MKRRQGLSGCYLGPLFRSFNTAAKTVEIEYIDHIDLMWRGFVDWLQSDASRFWIQGKPGSGKSTLVKSIIENQVTQTLLHRWRPEAQVLSIFFSFFWNIESPLQNNVKGMYYSLLYRILQDNKDLVSSMTEKFTFMLPKDNPHD